MLKVICLVATLFFTGALTSFLPASLICADDHAHDPFEAELLYCSMSHVFVGTVSQEPVIEDIDGESFEKAVINVIHQRPDEGASQVTVLTPASCGHHAMDASKYYYIKALFPADNGEYKILGCDDFLSCMPGALHEKIMQQDESLCADMFGFK